MRAAAVTGESGHRLMGGIDIHNLKPVEVGGSRHIHWSGTVTKRIKMRLTDIANSPKMPDNIALLSSFLMDCGAHWHDECELITVMEAGKKIAKKRIYFDGYLYQVKGKKVHRTKVDGKDKD